MSFYARSFWFTRFIAFWTYFSYCKSDSVHLKRSEKIVRRFCCLNSEAEKTETYFTNNLSILKLEAFCFYWKTHRYWFYVGFELLVSALGILLLAKNIRPLTPCREKKTSLIWFNPLSQRFFPGLPQFSSHQTQNQWWIPSPPRACYDSLFENSMLHISELQSFNLLQFKFFWTFFYFSYATDEK